MARTAARDAARPGVSDVNMDEGSLRADANVSLRPVGSEQLGTKTELKNMNSFRFLERGVAAEIERQRAILDAGEEVVQETLHFDPASGAISSLRSKEEAHDYRYFPEPDLVPIATTEAMLDEARAAMPELPAARAERFERELGLSVERARQLAFRAELGDFYERALAADGAHPRRLADWVGGELVGALGDQDPAASRVAPAALGALVAMVAERTLAVTAAREVLSVLVAEGGDPAQIVAARGLEAIDDEAGLAAIVARVIAADPLAAEQVRTGNAKAIGALVGPVMRETRGRADGAEVTRLIHEALGLGSGRRSAVSGWRQRGEVAAGCLGHTANDAGRRRADHFGHEHTQRPIQIPALPAGGRGVHDGEAAGGPAALRPCSPGSLRVTGATRAPPLPGSSSPVALRGSVSSSV